MVDKFILEQLIFKFDLLENTFIYCVLAYSIY